jgi:hypothetical protein
VRQFGVRVEGRLAGPFGMNEAQVRILGGLIHVDANAAGLGARRLSDAIQLLEKFVALVWLGLEAGEYIERQSDPPS